MRQAIDRLTEPFGAVGALTVQGSTKCGVRWVMEQLEEDEFCCFMRREHSRLFRTVYLLTGDYHQAEDVTQATWAKVYLRWPSISRMTEPGGYVRRIAINQAKSVWRWRSSREVVRGFTERNCSPGPAAAMAEHDLVWAAVLALPRRQREVVVLRFYEDLTEAETARVLGVAVGTVKSTCHAACRRLAGLIEEPAKTGKAGRSV